MKKLIKAIDTAMIEYTQLQIDQEISKNIEDVVFFSSYTIGTTVFRKATNKLKKKLKEEDFSELHLWEKDAQAFIEHYELSISPSTKKAYRHLLIKLMKSQIKINEAILYHFASLHKKAHDFSYLERRLEQIKTLLCD